MNDDCRPRNPDPRRRGRDLVAGPYAATTASDPAETAAIGSLFSGFGGLDQAVEEVFDARTAWVSDIDKGACKILAHRYPGVPNLGDITAIDWAGVEPVDIITGGSPCQDLSHAGKRAGMTEGTRSNLWVAMREAIAQLKPSIVVWENVRGAYSAAADSGLESDPGLLDSVRRRDGEPVLRALGRVLGDLAELGFDARWHGLRAADVGAPHGRYRVFVVAHAQSHGRDEGWPESAGFVGRSDAALGGDDAVKLLPTPTGHPEGETDPAKRAARVERSREKHGRPFGESLTSAIQLLPTPTTQDAANDGGPSQFDRNTPPLNAMVKLLPTPSVADTTGGHKARSGARSDEPLLNGAVLDFGQYAAAIDRWAQVLGRPAPAPTEPTGRNGAHRLSPRFVEWMMGCPKGWITDVPGVTRNEVLKALGNGVVKQQAVAALRLMLTRERATA